MDASRRAVPASAQAHSEPHTPEVSGIDPAGGPVHNDVAFIALTIAFFLLAGLLVVACDRIIGPDPVEEEQTTEEQLAA